MHIKGLAISALATAILAGCASQQPAEDKAMEATGAPAAKAMEAKAAKPKPKLMTGASTAMLANTCAGCHGTNGASTGPATPTIAGLEEEYFVDVMQEYKSGDRRSTIMGRIAKGYSDEEVKAIASYYSKIPFSGKTQTQVGPLARAGYKLHEKYCEKCHEDEGREPEDIVLAGQWMPYLHWTMEDYANGHNKYAEKKMAKAFKKMLAAHGDKSLLQLTHFYGSRK
jgi:sulfide dehydrogenase cytochrome subunit